MSSAERTAAACVQYLTRRACLARACAAAPCMPAEHSCSCCPSLPIPVRSKTPPSSLLRSAGSSTSPPVARSEGAHRCLSGKWIHQFPCDPMPALQPTAQHPLPCRPPALHCRQLAIPSSPLPAPSALPFAGALPGPLCSSATHLVPAIFWPTSTTALSCCALCFAVSGCA